MLKDRTRNEHIREKLKVESTEDKTRENQLRWFMTCNRVH